jgi:hypothetical protein
MVHTIVNAVSDILNHTNAEQVAESDAIRDTHSDTDPNELEDNDTDANLQ